MGVPMSLSGRKRLGNLVAGGAVWIIAITVYLIPLYYLIVNAVKNLQESTVLSLKPPSEIVLENFVVAFIDGKVLTGLWNSVAIVSMVIVTVIVCSSLASFYIQRSRSRLANFLFYLFVQYPSEFIVGSYPFCYC